MKNVVVIGGGASGIVASIFAKRKNNRVIVLERNSDVLKKLLMTGNGKCNYLNEVYGTKYYHSTDIDIVDKIISDKNINDVKTFFDDLGIVPKIKNGYYYPVTNQAQTIKNALVYEAKRVGVELVCNCLVKEVIKEKDRFIIKTDGEDYQADYVVFATGSCAYPKTGSDGLGYDFLKRFKHQIVEPVPALVQVVSDEKFLKKWDGVRTDAILSLFEDENYLKEEMGEVQLTSYGLSGICTFNLSHDISRGLALKKKEEIHINFVPFIETLISPWLDNYSKQSPDKNLTTLLEGFLNYKLVSIILDRCNLAGNLLYKDLDNKQKLLLCKMLRSFPVNIVGTKDFSSAQICNGGVRLTEIDYNTMESKLVKNLFITGELLDMNGNCGGYNLTTCWISGLLAGKKIGDECD